MKDEEREAEDWVVKIRMENVCMTASEGEMDWKEWREKTELHTALGSLILLTLCSGVRLLWKPPLYIPYTKVSMVTGPSLVTLGLPRTHSINHCWVAARRLRILQRPFCHSHITFPWEPTPVAYCEVVMETAYGQVAEDKWGDVREVKMPCVVSAESLCFWCAPYPDVGCLSRANAVIDTQMHI